eukprot:GDKI01025258.1.p1 GENE.GDKI01025258.1~~GDKI01025258.1.p1  ORF type:complete len:255 (-),score=51.66 GDKI01025258.1:24-788(-)
MPAATKVLITGASSGIGACLAVHLAKEGHELFLTGRNGANLQRVKEECLAAAQSSDKGLTTKVHTSLGDVADESCVDRQQQEWKSAFDGRLDVLVLNAGVGRSGGCPIEQNTSKDFDDCFNINVRGVFLWLNKTIPMLKAQKSGQIIVTSSVLGLQTVGNGRAVYAASKWAVEGLVGCVRKELAGSGVKIGLVNPALVDTAWWQEAERGGWPKPIDGSSFLPPDDVVSAMLYLINQGAKCDTERVVLQNYTEPK